MNRVASGILEDHWLPKGHPYRRRNRLGKWRAGYNRLRNDILQGKVRSEELAEYISVSVPVHSMDGWSLLGRSIHSLLRGDPYSAVHLAYYAELRAAVAVLASQGIAVFDKRHCVIDSDGRCALVEALDEDGCPMGPHQWAWEVFQWWADQPSSIEFLRQVIRPEGKPLSLWLSAMNKAQSALDAVGVEWLNLWGIDIKRYFRDRDARNLASYWPTTIDSWDTRDIVENYYAIADVWLSLEPVSESRFWDLDRHLLRIVLIDGYLGATDRGDAATASALDGLAEEVEYLLAGVGIGDSAKESLRVFLSEPELEEPTVIRMARGKSKAGNPQHVVEVLSRATMLLRLASGASAALLFDAGIKREELNFWIHEVGTERGIWSPEDPPGQLIDLWEPIDALLDDMDSIMEGSEPSSHDLWNERPKGLALLGECERIALWGLGL